MADDYCGRLVVKGQRTADEEAVCVRSDGDEVLYSLKKKHTHTPCCSVLEWLDSQCGEREREREREREAAEWGGDAARDGEPWGACASCPPRLRKPRGFEGSVIKLHASPCATLQSVNLTCWRNIVDSDLYRTGLI